MSNEDLLASWERTRGHLDRAWVALATNDAVDHSWFRECLDQNELELAMQALADASIEVAGPPEFWNALADAAAEMHLYDSEAVYRHRARRVD